MSGSPEDRAAAQVHAWAAELGFQGAGIARVAPPDPDGHLRAWLDRGYNAGLSYMAKKVADREDVDRLVPGAKSVVALAMSYRREGPEPEPPLKVSRYAMADDYHNMILKRSRRLGNRIKATWPGTTVKATVDTAPVLERAWAARAGVAWIGKSTMAISPRLGTYTFLSTLITTVAMTPDEPLPDRCGSCTRCLDACPTQAFPAPYVLDANKCITYWNVEHRGPFPEPPPELHGWVAGCDVCQQVCPWNKFGVITEERRFTPHPDMVRPDPAVFADPAAHDALERALLGTPLQRTGPDAVRRNARSILGR